MKKRNLFDELMEGVEALQQEREGKAMLKRVVPQHAQNGSREKFLAALDKVPDVEPEEWDRLP